MLTEELLYAKQWQKYHLTPEAIPSRPVAQRYGQLITGTLSYGVSSFSSPSSLG